MIMGGRRRCNGIHLFMMKFLSVSVFYKLIKLDIGIIPRFMSMEKRSSSTVENFITVWLRLRFYMACKI